MDLWKALQYFFTSDMLNPHGICLLWRPELLWTHATSDVLIGLAYFSIPAALGYFLHRRPDVKFSWAVWMFVAFIMLCGVTHFMMVWTLWNPDYGVEALIKAVTAGVSVTTAVALWPLLPKAIALPSGDTLQMRIDERDAALSDLRRAMNDMVEMREHERRQKLLLNELNHRVKNTLATVQAIAMQTASGTTDAAEFKTTFNQRLLALSDTHNLLVDRTWTGASLRELIARTLRHYGKPLTVSGPDLELKPNYAVTLGMALHELATNAVKYGAWSGDGAVAIDVHAADGGIVIRWTETGGPTVSTPTRKGFGMRLLESVGAELAGKVTLDYRPEGFVCEIRTTEIAPPATQDGESQP